MADARSWLHQARELFDDPSNGLATAATGAARGGFTGGAQWMRLGLTQLRGLTPTGQARFAYLGVVKYGLASLMALATLAVAWMTSRWLIPVAIVAFYAVEVRMVFAFPAALDGESSPLMDSHRLLRSHAPWPWSILQVMRIATEMLIGGILGRGFVRSWCIGCLAVLLWYEEARSVRGTCE